MMNEADGLSFDTVIVSAAEISQCVKRLARELERTYTAGEEVVAVVVLSKSRRVHFGSVIVSASHVLLRSIHSSRRRMGQRPDH